MSLEDQIKKNECCANIAYCIGGTAMLILPYHQSPLVFSAGCAVCVGAIIYESKMVARIQQWIDKYIRETTP